jgi:hypothetical protein
MTKHRLGVIGRPPRAERDKSAAPTSRASRGFAKLDLSGRESAREAAEPALAEEAGSTVRDALDYARTWARRPAVVLTAGALFGCGLGFLLGVRVGSGDERVAFAATVPQVESEPLPTAETAAAGSPAQSDDEVVRERFPAVSVAAAPPPRSAPARGTPPQEIPVTAPPIAAVQTPVTTPAPGTAVPAALAVSLPAIGEADSGTVGVSAPSAGPPPAPAETRTSPPASAGAAPPARAPTSSTGGPGAADGQRLVSVLERLVQAQNAFHRQERSYAAIKVLRALGTFSEPEDVAVTVTKVDGVSFAAIAASRAHGASRCGVYLGSATPPHASLAAPGVVGCW